jgi:hypothetical protein
MWAAVLLDSARNHHPEKFQAEYSFRRYLSFGADNRHFGGLVIPFSEIQTISGVSETTIVKHHQHGKPNDRMLGDRRVPVRRYWSIGTNSVSTVSKSTIR